MEQFFHFIGGFAVALEPINLWYAFLGCVMGTIVGVLPGLGPAAGMALLIPATFGMEPASAIIMLAGLYYGAQYGGSTTSILINTPGEASSVMTTLDGFQMARSGRAGAALAVAAIGSFIAGTIGVILLSVLAVPLSRLALTIGPAEYFALLLFSMASVTSLTGSSLPKAAFAVMIGLMIATVGIDLQSGTSRFTGDIPELQDGIGFIVAAVGLFAISEVFVTLEQLFKGKSEFIGIKGTLWLNREEWRRARMPILRGSFIGFFKGILPGGGATIATILSYSLERSLSKEPEKFGTGMIEGVAGPESANNAAATGAFVPLLALGLPGSASTAILLGAFMIYGVQPGPQLLVNEPQLVWGLIDSMYIGNVILFILNLPLIMLFVRILYVPAGIMLPLILVVASIGVYSLNESVVELFLALSFGVLGYLMRKLSIPIPPLVLSIVLGGLLEKSFRQALTISGGDIGILVGSPIAITLLLASVFVFCIPFIPKRKHTKVESIAK
ncbi:MULTISPECIES: tripartite tricarboxylate transporter permease [unclassified Sinorhizobium]|uniref:tripartite tricarboxylate transporter permease n=1 Tax=unclassified Sinorhizobium TaxID=2613772 RepID=UPI00352699C8